MSPKRFEYASHWREDSKPIMAGIEAWRRHHLHATLQEIEATVDAR